MTTFKIFLTICCGLLLSACSSKSTQSQFYMLNIDVSDLPTVQSKYTSIGIGPIEVATYLQQSQLVTQESDNRYKLNEFNRWIEPLDDTITSAMSTVFAHQLGIKQVYTYPWLEVNPDLHLTIKLHRFHCQINTKQCDLVAAWTLRNGKTGKQIKSDFVTESLPLSKNDFVTVVETLSDLLKNLSKRIVTEIQG
ncbi:MAG: PqiC family protein [Bdellovibrionota bacterium]|jgi:uncharacterized lipoprotein YmbA